MGAKPAIARAHHHPGQRGDKRDENNLHRQPPGGMILRGITRLEGAVAGGSQEQRLDDEKKRGRHHDQRQPGMAGIGAAHAPAVIETQRRQCAAPDHGPWNQDGGGNLPQPLDQKQRREQQRHGECGEKIRVVAGPDARITCIKQPEQGQALQQAQDQAQQKMAALFFCRKNENRRTARRCGLRNKARFWFGVRLGRGIKPRLPARAHASIHDRFGRRPGHGRFIDPAWILVPHAISISRGPGGVLETWRSWLIAPALRLRSGH